MLVSTPTVTSLPSVRLTGGNFLIFIWLGPVVGLPMLELLELELRWALPCTDCVIGNGR